VAFALIESNRKLGGKSLLGGGSLSTVVHAAIIGAAVLATISADRGSSGIALDTALVFLAPPPEHQTAPTPPPALDMPLKGFQTLTVPAIVPAAIPPVDLQEHFDPKDFSGTGVEGGRAAGVDPGPDRVYAAAVVDEPPELLAAPPPEYPPLLRQAGITGRVVLQAVIDTTGRADPASVQVLQSPNPGFNIPSQRWILKALFRPARLGGRLVRVLVSLPLDYSLTERTGS
jgi:protein TonB